MIDLSPAMARPAPLPGHIIRPDQNRSKLTYHQREGVAQVSQMVWGGAFDGIRNLGVYVDGALYNPGAQANSAAFVAAVALLLAGKATFVEKPGNIYEIAFLDAGAATHVVDDYDPDAGLTLADPTTEQAAIPKVYVYAGMGLVWKDTALRIAQAPLPDSVIADYVGVVDRMWIQSRTITANYGYPNDALVHGQELRCHRHTAAYLLAGQSTVQKDPVYLGTTGLESGRYYKAAGGGRILVPFGMWMTTATADAAYGLQANFTP